MKKLPTIKPHPCKECAARGMDERFGELYARAERLRREDESLPDALRRLAVDDAFRAYEDDEAAIARALSYTPQAINKIANQRLRDREEARRFVRAV